MAPASPAPVALALATPRDVPEAAELYAAAFADNPAYASIFSGLPDSDRPRALRWLLGRRMRALMAAGSPFVVARDPETGRVVAAGGAVLPGRAPGMLRLLWHGLAVWPLLWGRDSMRRALHIDRLASRGSGGSGSGGSGGKGGSGGGGAIQRGGKCRLAMLAVSESWRRRGVASALLARLLAEVGARCPHPPRVVLDTQHAGAVELYQRHGFRLVAEDRIQPLGGGAAFTSWTMALETQPPHGQAAAPGQ